MSTLSLRKIKHDSASVDNITLDSNGNLTTAGTIAQSKAMTTQYDGIGVRMGSSTANTNRGATFLQHTYVDAGGNQGNYVYNHSLRQNDGTYIANVYTADYSAGVHSWYHPNGGLSGNPVMQIDASGRVILPYQTYALCGFTSAYNSFTVSSNNDIIMDTATQRGSSYNTSNGRFTAPVNGLYHIFISLMMNPPNANANRLALRKNGSDFQISFDVVQPANGYMQGTGGGSQQSNLNLTCILPLNAGDYVNFAARSGSSVGPIYGGHSWGFFYLIG